MLIFLVKFSVFEGFFCKFTILVRLESNVKERGLVIFQKITSRQRSVTALPCNVGRVRS